MLTTLLYEGANDSTTVAYGTGPQKRGSNVHFYRVPLALIVLLTGFVNG